MATKNNPGKFDCYSNAAPDEPMFVLLGRDPMAGSLVRQWADLREAREEDPAKVAEARACAEALDQWARSLGKRPRVEWEVPLETEAVEVFDEVELALQRDREDATRLGSPLNANHVRGAIRRALERAYIKGATRSDQVTQLKKIGAELLAWYGGPYSSTGDPDDEAVWSKLREALR